MGRGIISVVDLWIKKGESCGCAERWTQNGVKLVEGCQAVWLDNFSFSYQISLMQLQSASQVSVLMAKRCLLSQWPLRKMTLKDCMDFAGVAKLDSKLTLWIWYS